MENTTDLDVARSMARLWGAQARERAAFYRVELRKSVTRWERITYLIEQGVAGQDNVRAVSSTLRDDGAV